MKKLLLVAAASAAILSSSSSFAEGLGDNPWYLRLDAGVSMLTKEKDKATGLKMKSNTVFVGDIGAGYYLMDNLRADLTFSLSSNTHLKKSGISNNGVFSGLNGTIKHKPNIMNLFLNGYVDFVDLSMFKLFAGGGIGSALVKEKVTYNPVGGNAGSDTLSVSTKHHYNFSYQLSLGMGTEVSEGVIAELAYKWADFGKAKSKNVSFRGKTISVGGLHLKGHNVLAGIRFDI
jgi:opacity protein-like surface antigen